MNEVPDIGDPLFSVWRLSWIAHQLPRNPATLFDANIFYPERRTLAYSDSIFIPGVVAAPFLWSGLNRIVVYNLLFTSAFVFSGWTMYLLVRALTGRRDAAVVAGAVFALYPYRFEHYSHLELQMTMWMPLALWGLHRTLARARVRDGLLTGLAFALQTLSSLYYGAFFAAYLAVAGTLLWIGRPFRFKSIGMLAAGTALAAILISPVASQYIASVPVRGEWNLDMVRAYSAQPRDYLKPHASSRVYGGWSHDGLPERQLFPTLTPLALALVGACPPMSTATIAYTVAWVFTVDASLGMNGVTFRWLRHAPLYRSIRAPARMSILGGMTLAILSGFGAARLFGRWPRARVPIAAAILMLIAIETRPSLRLERVWAEPPAIYASLTGQTSGALAEFPTPEQTGLVGSDTRYLDFSTVHWHPLLNGYSGFFPDSYIQFLQKTSDFPSGASLQYLRERGVEYIAWHGAFTIPVQFRIVARRLDARSDLLELVAAAPWQGGESRLYRFRRD